MPSLPLLSSFFFLVLATTTYSATYEEHYANCAPLNNLTCAGSPLNITYPFWFSTVTPDYCGHPNFRLDCLSNGFTLEINNQNYVVMGISYESKVLNISKSAFYQTSCPHFKTDITNTSLDFSLFDYTSNSENVTLFYNCSASYPSNASNPSPFDFTCPLPLRSPSFVSLINYVTTKDDKRVTDELRRLCELEIVFPAFQADVTAFDRGLLGGYDVPARGFQVQWKVDQKRCDACLKSGGRCGYNETINSPVCFCKDAVYNDSCRLLGEGDIHDGKKKMHSTLIGLLVAGAYLICMVIASVVFAVRRYRMAKVALPDASVPDASRLDPSTSRAYNYFGVNIFSYGELEEATASFDPTNRIGRGGYGIVYRGTLRDGREVAIKRTFERSDRNVKQFLNEIEILAKVTHSNLVTLYGCTSQESRELLLVYEYISNGTCADHLHGSKAGLGLLTWPRRLSLAVETASALAYLHSLDIIHRDVKTQNLLLDEDLSVKVGDFGISRLFPVDASHVSTIPQGTPGYADPDYYRTYRVTDRSDVYSFGVVLAELISSKKAVDTTRKDKDINLATMFQETMDNSLDEFVDPFLGFDTNADIKSEVEQVGKLAFRCLEKEKTDRPSMQDVYNELHRIQLKEEEAGPSIQALIDELRNQNELQSIAETSEIVEIP